MPGETSILLVSRVREYLGDSSREKIKSDIPIYDKLTFYQDYLMTVKLLSRLRVTYPLVSGQSQYPFLQNVVSHTSVWFNDTIFNGTDYCGRTPNVTITQTTSGDDARAFTISNYDKFVTGADFMYSEAFTRPMDDQIIGSKYDPIIEKIYHELLIEHVVGYFNSPPDLRIKMVLLHTDEIAQALKKANRFQAFEIASRTHLNF